MKDGTALNAQCICGGVSLSLPNKPVYVFGCYCTDCQKAGGGPCTINLMYEWTAVTVHDDQKLLAHYESTNTYSGMPKTRSFCGRCGTTLLERISKVQRAVFVRSTLVDGGIEKFPPTGEIFCKDQPSFMKHMTSTDSTHHYEFQAEGGDLVKLLD